MKAMSKKRLFELEQSLVTLQKQFNELYNAKEFFRLLAASRQATIEELEARLESKD
jgi:hypothetical protein